MNRTPGLLAAAFLAIQLSPTTARAHVQGPAAPSTSPATADDGGASAAAQIDPRARAQLLTLAPYISMMSPLAQAKVGVGDTLEEIARLKEFNDSTFDADPALLRASRDIVSFLVLSGQRPTTPDAAAAKEEARRREELLRLAAEVDPELAFGVAVLQLFAEAGKQEAVRSWQVQHDEKCRKAYQGLMPLFRRTALGKKLGPADTAPVLVRPAFTKDSWVYLEAVNLTGATLTNVTLAVRMETIDGRSSDHYYFIPEWSAAKKRYPLRMAADWAPGALATTCARVELLSDQVVTGRVENDLADHVPSAADLYHAEIEPQVKGRKKLKGAIDRLEAMAPALGLYPDRAKKNTELLSRARTSLQEITAKIDARMQAIGDEIEQLEKQSKRKGGESGDKVRDARVKKLEAERRTLKAERQEWMSGER